MKEERGCSLTICECLVPVVSLVARTARIIDASGSLSAAIGALREQPEGFASNHRQKKPGSFRKPGFAKTNFSSTDKDIRGCPRFRLCILRIGSRINGGCPPNPHPLDLDVEAWVDNVERYGGLFRRLAGKLERLKEFADATGRAWIQGQHRARQLYADAA